MTAVRPADTAVHLVMHLPFPGSIVAGKSWHDPLPIAIPGATEEAFPHDLMLQHYASDLADDMRHALPHREGSSELPGWPGASLDRWSVGVSCLMVIEEMPTRAQDWNAYRAEAQARREAVRARATDELGREPLWLHPLHVVRADGEPEDLDAIAVTLTDNGAKCVLDAFPGAVLRIALDAAVVVRPDRMQVAAGAARMLGVHTAIWAAALEFDRELLPLLDRKTETESVAGLERRADELRHTSRRVRAFRAPLDNVSAHLSELDMPLWRHIGDRWKLHPQLDALTRRIDALQHVHADLLGALTSKHAQRLNKIALALALLSACTAIFTVVQFVIAEPKPTELRALNAGVVVAVAVLAGVLWWTSVERTRSTRK